MFVAFLNGTLGTMMATTIGGWREIDGSEQANPDKVESASFNSAPSSPRSSLSPSGSCSMHGFPSPVPVCIAPST